MALLISTGYLLSSGPGKLVVFLRYSTTNRVYDRYERTSGIQRDDRAASSIKKWFRTGTNDIVVILIGKSYYKKESLASVPVQVNSLTTGLHALLLLTTRAPAMEVLEPLCCNMFFHVLRPVGFSAQPILPQFRRTQTTGDRVPACPEHRRIFLR
jgi:hypothetical protein